MQPLLELVNEARALAEGEAARQLQICNACRYCEGFCAVFPAMTRRLEFGPTEVHYLANLCHGCGACLHACQYAPPHEFAVSIPQALAKVRASTYEAYAWPSAFGALYQRQGLVIALAVSLALAGFFVASIARNGSLLHAPLAGNFYALFPHGLLVSVFGTVSLLVLLSMGFSLSRFWRDVGTPGQADASALRSRPQVQKEALAETAGDTLGLRYLGDCPNEDDATTPLRRRMHHLTFYGFGLCFAATSLATVYHYVFALVAPYAYTSLPVLLGTAGGISMTLGTSGLWILNRRRHRLHKVAEHSQMDLGFIALLWLLATTGLALLAVRDTSWMGMALALHLGVVMAFFLLAPYCKFMHGFYRVAALFKHAVEKRLPTTLKLGGD